MDRAYIIQLKDQEFSGKKPYIEMLVHVLELSQT